MLFGITEVGFLNKREVSDQLRQSFSGPGWLPNILLSVLCPGNLLGKDHEKKTLQVSKGVDPSDAQSFSCLCQHCMQH